jgi:hypothetical protein
VAQPAVPSQTPDFRRRLIIDRYSSVLSRLPRYRLSALADPQSPDADIWNTFRTLEQIDPDRWIPRLLALGGIRPDPTALRFDAGVALTLWKRVRPPAERLEWLRRRALDGALQPPVGRRRKGRVIPLSELRRELAVRAKARQPLEEPVEVDVIIKTARRIVFVEIPNPHETPEEPSGSDRTRTYVLRLIDAGLAYAEARGKIAGHPVGFSLLVLTGDGESGDRWRRALAGLARVPERLRRSFPHWGRGIDPADVARNLGAARWSEIDTLLRSLRRDHPDELEARQLERLLKWGASGAPASS